MTSMTKRIPVCKNMTGNCGKDAEEESPASECKTETVGKPTGKAPDMQNVQDVTETVMEERAVEEIPPNTWEQVPQHLSTERHEMTGESSNHTGKVQLQEVTKQSPQIMKVIKKIQKTKKVHQRSTKGLTEWNS